MQVRLHMCARAFRPALVLGMLLSLTACVGTAATATPGQAATSAAGQACLIEGSVRLLGKSVPARDCLQVTGSDTGALASVCQTALQALAQRVKDAGGEAPRMSLLQACPAGAFATCEGYAGLPLTAHYYQRDAAQLQATKDRCLAQGGQWRP